MVGDGALLAPLEGVGVGGHLGGPVAHVLAVVAVLGRLLALGPGRQRGRVVEHLGAAVVQVVLAGDHVAGALEQPHHGVAIAGVAAVASVQGAGGVGAHPLDVDAAALAEVGAGVAVGAGGEDLAQQVVQPRVVQPEVHEAGPGHLDGSDVLGRGRAERLGDAGGQLAGVPAGLLGRHQRHVRRPVAVLAPGRALELDGVGQGLDLERRQRGPQGLGELVADHQVAPSGGSS